LLSAKLLDAKLDERCITVIDCESKDNMPFFLKIANAFGVPYSVMFDTDSDKAEGSQKSKLVMDALDKNLCISIQQMEPRLEAEMGLSDTEKLRPADVIRKFSGFGPNNVPAKVKDIIERTVS
jgi:CRISPR-associated exonuclease Cas4